MRKHLPITLALLMTLFAYGASAQKRKDDARQANLNSLVQSELEFARTAKEKGTREAFLAFAAEDGIIFRRTAVNARQTWSQAPASTGLLSWYPIFADVSGAGDLGYTTGPYEFREKAGDEKPAGQGYFMTIWRRQADGSWKFALDLGTRNAPNAPGSAPALAFVPGTGARARVKAPTQIEAEHAALLGAERKLNTEAARRGTAAALLAHLADDARLYRQNALPVVGKERIRGALKTQTSLLSWQPVMAHVSQSTDLAYAYGTYEARARGESTPTEQGNYVRIWKRRGGHDWQIVLDLLNPVPPPRPAAQ